MKAAAVFKTEQASRHLGTLCHHFGRKVPATCNARNAQIIFPFGQCEMEADDGELKLLALAADENCLNEVVEVMTRHLERFAFRENPKLEWQPVDSLDPAD